MIKYEVMFILRPTLDEAQKEATVEQVKSIVEADGNVTETKVWGLKKLAYPIEKHAEGYYVVMNFEAPEEMPKELDRRLKISDNVIRHMIIREDEK